MADKIFFIEGKPDEIFNVGFRPALMGKAAELGLKSAATNIQNEKENKVQVLVSGSANIINSYYQRINKNDIRVKRQESKPTFRITQLEEYNGPNIDWSGYQLSLMSEQMYKGFHEANERLVSIEKKLKPPYKKRVKSGKKRP
jgi:acylphosphatase